MCKINIFKKLGLLLIGILSFQLALSQENYIPGYVIRNNGDTLFGLVDYRDWGNNPDLISFKARIDEHPVSFTPTDIIEFSVGGEIYVSGIINVKDSQIDVHKSNGDPHITLKVDTAFLLTLFSGEKKLFYYNSNASGESFYIEKNKVFDLLLFKRYSRKQNDKSVIAENRTYMSQLSLYLNECPTIESKLSNTMYTYNSLIKLFQYYYTCTSSELSFQKEIRRTRVEIGCLAGISITSLRFKSENFKYLVNTDYNTSLNFSSGLFFDFFLHRNHGKWSINNEILFSAYKMRGKYDEFENENYHTLTTTEIGYKYLKINNLIRLKYPVGQLFMFINGGISNGISIGETNYRRKEIKFHSTDRIVEELAIEKTRKNEQGFILGTGLSYNKFSLEIRFEIGNGMSNHWTLISTTKRFYFLLGYRF